MNPSKFFAAFSIASVLFISASLDAADWYRWRGPNLNGISQEKDWQPKFPADGPKILWKASIGIGFSSFSTSDGRVFTMGNDKDTDTVFCYDTETGKEIWKHSYPCPLDPKYYEGGTSATPTIDGDRVYTFSRKGDLFCLEKKTGKVVWSKNLEKELGVKIPTWGFAGSPVVEKDLLLLNVGSHGTALEKKSGKLVWTSDKSPSGYSSAVPTEYDGKRCAVFAGEKSIFAVTVADGKLVWEHPWKTEYDVNAAEPIVSGDKVFISSGYNHGCAVLQIKGGKATVVWENKILKNHINSSLLIGGFLYGFDGNAGPKADFRCVDFATGTEKWSEPKLGAGALMAADGKLIIHTDKGELIIAEATPDGFKPIGRAQVTGGRNWTTPVLSNGRIYCRNSKGDMVCLDARK